jgi:hypothetical protein
MNISKALHVPRPLRVKSITRGSRPASA